MTKKKIVQITPKYFPSLGGVEKHVAAVNAELLAQGYEVVVLTTQHDKQLLVCEIVDGIEVYRLPFKSIHNKFETWKWIQGKQRVFENTIVQVHDVAWWLVPVLPKFYRKFFITFHGWEGIYPVPFFNKLQRLLFARFAEKTIHVGAYIQKFYWDKPTIVLYGGVTDTTKTVPAPKTPNATKITCVFVGRLVHENDIERYIELLEILKKSGVSVEMQWVGDGALKTSCQKYGTVTGMVSDVNTYIDKADFVFASSYLSILEAQLQQKVVCSLYSHNLKKEYLTSYPGSNWMLTAQSAQEMSKNIFDLLSDKKKFIELSQGAHNFAKQQTWKKVAEQYLNLWSEKTT